MNEFGRSVYAVSYYAGVQTLRLLHRIGRFFAFFLHPILYLLRRTAGAVIVGVARGLRARWRVLCRDMRGAGRRIAAAWRRHPLRGVAEVFIIPFAALYRHRRMARGLLRFCALVVAIATLLLTFQYWNGITYAVALENDGDVWGYVADEAVLQTGTAMAMERVSGVYEWKELNAQPSMALSMVHESDILDTTEVCDLLLEKSELSLMRACGLYVDGVLQGAVYDERTAEELLDDILVESCEGQTGVTASFFQKVELIEGLYPQSAVVPAQTMKNSLTSEGAAKEFYEVQAGDTLWSVSQAIGVSVSDLRKLNRSLGDTLSEGQTLLIRDSEPHLQVLVSGVVEYEVEVPFTTQRVADASEYKGYERVRVQGKNGVNRITATATYLDGEELSCVIISSTVVEEPVTHVVAYGTKELTSKTYKGGPYATGRFMWPVPYTRYITQYFGSASGHGAIDIADTNIRGQDIVAADGGTVVISAYRKGTSYGSYGKYIVIDHGGGYQTLYAHCDELLVSPGDVVKQGQVIAKVGNTGRSEGPHLHFEIQINGRRVNPMTFF